MIEAIVVHGIFLVAIANVLLAGWNIWQAHKNQEYLRKLRIYNKGLDKHADELQQFAQRAADICRRGAREST